MKEVINTEELRLHIQRSGFKLGHIANQLGITRYGLQKKIDNVTEFKATEISTICRLLNITDGEQIKHIFLQNK